MKKKLNPYNILNSDINNLELISSMDREKFNKYLEISKKYSPFFQKNALYEDMNAEKIANVLFQNKNIKLNPRSFNQLTTWVAFSSEFELYLQLCSRIVTDLALIEEEYDLTVDQLQNTIKIDEEIKKEIEELKSLIDTKVSLIKDSEDYKKYVDGYLKENSHLSEEEINVVKPLLINHKIREVVENDVREYLNKNFPKIVKKTNYLSEDEKIVFKSQDKTSSRDIVVLGPFATGKSSIVKIKVTEEEIRNSINISCDDYRVFAFHFNKSIEKDFTGSDFLKRNNYLITDQVQQIIWENIRKRVLEFRKSNNFSIGLIIERNIYDIPDMKENAIPMRKDTICLLPSYYGNSTWESGPAFRAFNRAEKAKSPNDARYAKTHSTLHSHMDFMFGLLIPYMHFDFDTEIIDIVGKNLNGDLVEGGSKLIAKIFSKNDIKKHMTIEVYDPIAFFEFINKSNINVDAKHPIEVMMKKKSGNGLMVNIDEKVRVFRKFCEKAEERGLKILKKEDIIKEFIDHENRIFNFKSDNGTFGEKYVGDILSDCIVREEFRRISRIDFS